MEAGYHCHLVACARPNGQSLDETSFFVVLVRLSRWANVHGKIGRLRQKDGKMHARMVVFEVIIKP